MNAEQKQRAIKLITYWRNRSITTMPEEYFVSGDCMTDLLQELIDAPEPEPVGYTNETELDYVRKYEALPVSGTFWPTSDEDACVALYTAPPANNQSEQHLGMVPADVAPGAWRYVIPGRRRTEKFDSSRVGDYNQGWNDCRKITEKALNDLEKRK